MSPRHFSRLSLCAAAIGALAVAAFAVAPSRAAEEAVIIPAPAADIQPASDIQTAVIAGGCFWGVQGVFQHTAGVINAVSGYAGGSKTTADYNMVSMGPRGTRNRSRSSTTRRRSATARSCRSSSRWCTTRPN